MATPSSANILIILIILVASSLPTIYARKMLQMGPVQPMTTQEKVAAITPQITKLINEPAMQELEVATIDVIKASLSLFWGLETEIIGDIEDDTTDNDGSYQVVSALSQLHDKIYLLKQVIRSLPDEVINELSVVGTNLLYLVY